MNTIYKVLYSKILTAKGEREGEYDFSFSAMFTDKDAAIKKCAKYEEEMRCHDCIVSQYENADFYIWIREYTDKGGHLVPTAGYPYACIEDGVLKTPHLSTHFDYFRN